MRAKKLSLTNCGLKLNVSILSFSGILKETVGLCKAGASVRDTCINADKRIEEETGKAFKKDKTIQKGSCGFVCMNYVGANLTKCLISI